MTDTPPPSRPLKKWWNRFAYVFNRTALGLGVLAGGYSLYNGEYIHGVLLFALVPVYFYLKDRYDAP